MYRQGTKFIHLRREMEASALSYAHAKGRCEQERGLLPPSLPLPIEWRGRWGSSHLTELALVLSSLTNHFLSEKIHKAHYVNNFDRNHESNGENVGSKVKE